jgi:hypothetical protein
MVGELDLMVFFSSSKREIDGCGYKSIKTVEQLILCFSSETMKTKPLHETPTNDGFPFFFCFATKKVAVGLLF